MASEAKYYTFPLLLAITESNRNGVTSEKYPESWQVIYLEFGYPPTHPTQKHSGLCFPWHRNLGLNQLLIKGVILVSHNLFTEDCRKHSDLR